MCVAFDADDDLTTGLRGADLLVGRKYASDGSASAETFDENAKDSAAWSTLERLDGAKWSLDGNKLQISVPVEFFKNGDPQKATFKILDSVPLDSPADFYDKGDVAPESAFFYSVEFEP